MEQQAQSPSLEAYVNQLLQEKGVSHLDPGVVEQMRLDLLDRLDDRINAAMLSALPAEKAEEFTSKIDAMSEEEAQAYLQANITDLNEIIASELLRFRQLYLAA